MLEMTGYDEDDLLGRPVETLLPEDRRAPHGAHRRRYAAHPTLRPMGSDLDIVCRRRDGSVFHADIALSPLPDDADGHVVAAVRDATARRAADEAIARLQLLEQQEQLGRDLHDGVIQSVFAVGMTLQGLIARVDDPVVVDRLQQAIGALDDTITELRAFIFGLGKPLSPDATRAELERLVARGRDTSGIDITGVIEDGAVAAVGTRTQDLVLVAREALSNVARHSAARRCELAVRLVDGDVVLTITDDGRGFDVAAPSQGLGIANARTRAQRAGADYVIESSPAGTTVRLRMPGIPR